MLTIDAAFAKFRGRQELTDAEQKDVSRRHNEVRDIVVANLDVERDFLSGSYARWTKTRPLRDVDVLCVLGDDERRYRKEYPEKILKRVESALAPIYGKEFVTIDRMAVTVDFGVAVDDRDEADDKVMSIDIVPAFSKNGHYEIPDARTGGWISTDPEVHADLAVKAHAAYSAEWKPLVRMIKKWNRSAGDPIDRGFLLEVMALDLLRTPWTGAYPHELKAFFATAAERVCESWPDPAGLGPPVNEGMTDAQCAAAADALRAAERQASRAIVLARSERTGDALRCWRDLFGPHFPLS